VFRVVGYFTIALKTLEVITKLDSETHKKLDGIFSYSRDSEKTIFPVFLIGQLARNDAYTKDDLSGEDILSDIYDLIYQVRKLIGGRIILLECENKQDLNDFYESNGFLRFPYKSTGRDDLIKYIKILEY
jgi:hypothetical protein